MNEYPIKPAYKILGQLLAAVLIIFGIFLFNRGLHWDGPKGAGPMIVLGVLAFSVGAWLMVGATRLCLTVDDDAVRVRGGLGNRVLPLGDIDGYRYGEKNRFYLVRKNGNGFIIPDYIAQRKEFVEWVKSQYIDVDARERERETKVVLQDERYGATEEDRKAALRKARTVAFVLTIISGLPIVLLIYIPDDKTVISFMYVFPWIAIFLTWRSNGLIRLSMRKGTPHPSLVYMMGISSFFLGIYALARFKLYGFDGHAWMVTFLITLVTILLTLAALRGTIALERKKTAIAVNRALFYSIHRNDTVNISLYPGRWGMPWYRVTEADHR